jgi:glutathione S-transferase
MMNATPHLVIGNKNYSSWSLRPWIAMRATGIAFTEEVIALDQPDTRDLIRAHGGSLRVPVLHHGPLVIWESLAIVEYLAETFPEAGLWPKAADARALARSVSNEMHAGFTALRAACPMNMRREKKRLAISAEAQADARRIEDLWKLCRDRHGQGGPFLFGAYSAADAMYAPVVNRFEVYDIPVSRESRAYMEAVRALPAWREWEAAGKAETWIIPHDEA